VVGYSSDDDEAKILRLVRGEESSATAKKSESKLPQKAVLDARSESQKTFVSDAIEKYLVSLIAASRRPGDFSPNLKKWIQVGASPRGTLALDRCSPALAWLQGRDHVTPDDVRAIAPECLRHRLILTYEAAADGVTSDQVVAEIVKTVAVP